MASIFRTSCILAALALSLGAAAQPAKDADDGPRWSTLDSAQRAALAPLQGDWERIDADQKEKWVDIASRFPRMSQDERERVQARMTQWAKLSPRERGDVRLRYREARQASPEGRQGLWNQYQTLSDDERRALAERASAKGSVADDEAKRKKPRRVMSVDDEVPKSNIVPNPALAGQPRPVSPSVVKARPGATTSLITTQAEPPAHQQTGLPKIVATPEFVNRSTLLPQRGAQGAATTPAAAASAAPRRR